MEKERLKEAANAEKMTEGGRFCRRPDEVRDYGKKSPPSAGRC